MSEKTVLKRMEVYDLIYRFKEAGDRLYYGIGDNHPMSMAFSENKETYTEQEMDNFK